MSLDQSGKIFSKSVALLGPEEIFIWEDSHFCIIYDTWKGSSIKFRIIQKSDADHYIEKKKPLYIQKILKHTQTVHRLTGNHEATRIIVNAKYESLK